MSKPPSLLKIPSPLLQLFWATLLLAVASCSDGLELSDMPPPETLSNAPAIVQEARKQLQEQGNFHLLNMQGWGARAMRGASSSENTLTAEHVRWEKYHLFKDGEQECAAIPIESGVRTALTVLNTDGRVRKTRNKVTTKLIVRREQDGKLTLLLGTYVYDQNYARDYGDEIPHLGYLFERTHFTGYFMTSWLQNGRLILGRRLKNGVEGFTFRSTPPSRAKSNSRDSGTHLYIGLDGSTRMTRSAQLEEESSDELLCSFCNQPASRCGCVEVKYCSVCQEQIQNGECSCTKKCAYCGFPKKECNCCATCHKNKSQCICHNPDSEEWSSSSGSSSGDSGGGSSSWAGDGGSGGGNPYPSPDFGPSIDYGGGSGNVEIPDKKPERPKQNPSYSLNHDYKFSRSELIDGAKAAIAEILKTDKNGVHPAKCNLGVQAAFRHMFPGEQVPGMSDQANQMVRDWQHHPEKWQKISLGEAQKCANNGLFVVAGWVNSNGHGHVVVIVPGTPVRSNRFNADMPCTMDTGEGMRTITYLHYSFGKEKIPHVVFYYYKH